MALLTTDDGSHTLFSERYGVSYHSRYGAVTESAHVFIDAGLRYKAAVQREIAVLEVGFGTGLNAFLSCLEAGRRNLSVHYLGLEAYPVTVGQARQFNYSALLGAPERAADFLRLHEAEWNVEHLVSEHFIFQKQLVRLETFEPPEAAFDLVYFDAFAPQAQPELWTAGVFARLYRALRPEGALVTYCAQGEFKRTLKKAGFLVERLQGPPGKREMTRALK